MRGRKPKPTILKIIAGNPGHQRLNRNEPQPERKCPVCPRWLAPAAKQEWARLAPEMGKLGLLTGLDRATFAGYCSAFAHWRAAEEMLGREGLLIPGAGGELKPHPAARLARQFGEQMLKFGLEFGMTPSARTRIHVSSSISPMDELNRILNSGPKVD